MKVSVILDDVNDGEVIRLAAAKLQYLEGKLEEEDETEYVLRKMALFVKNAARAQKVTEALAMVEDEAKKQANKDFKVIVEQSV